MLDIIFQFNCFSPPLVVPTFTSLYLCAQDAEARVTRAALAAGADGAPGRSALGALPPAPSATDTVSEGYNERQKAMAIQVTFGLLRLFPPLAVPTCMALCISAGR